MRMMITSAISLLIATTAHATDDEAGSHLWETTRNVAGTTALAGLVAMPVGGVLMALGATDGGGGPELEAKLLRRYEAGVVVGLSGITTFAAGTTLFLIGNRQMRQTNTVQIAPVVGNEWQGMALTRQF